MIDGLTLRVLRKRTGRTQHDVAEAVGIPASVLSAYERGRRDPGLRMAARIIDALGFRVQFTEMPDAAAQGRELVEVLGLAEALPYEPRPLARARR